jgi:hypothetical protein
MKHHKACTTLTHFGTLSVIFSIPVLANKNALKALFAYNHVAVLALLCFCVDTHIEIASLNETLVSSLQQS